MSCPLPHEIWIWILKGIASPLVFSKARKEVCSEHMLIQCGSQVFDIRGQVSLSKGVCSTLKSPSPFLPPLPSVWPLQPCPIQSGFVFSLSWLLVPIPFCRLFIPPNPNFPSLARQLVSSCPLPQFCFSPMLVPHLFPTKDLTKYQDFSPLPWLPVSCRKSRNVDLNEVQCVKSGTKKWWGRGLGSDLGQIGSSGGAPRRSN